MSLVKIGFFSLKDHTGCSSFAIHAANYIAGGDNSVAVIEPDTVLEPQYADVQVEKNEDGSFEFNNIHFYPQGCMTEPTEDILIYDFGKVTIFQKFDNSYDMLYLCTSGDISNISDIGEYLTESNAKCELILSGASKEEFQEFKNNGYTCIAVSDKKEMVCPYDLAVKLGLTLRRKGIVDPVYHKDWTYDALPFKKEEAKEEKKSFFGSLFGKKKKDKKAEESIPVQDVPVKTEPEGEEAGLAEEKYHVKANEFGSFDDFEDVPVPEITAELSKKEQRAAEKAAEKKKKQEEEQRKKEEAEAKAKAEAEEKEKARQEELKRREELKKAAEEEAHQKQLKEQAEKELAEKKKAEEDAARQVELKKQAELKKKQEEERKRKEAAEAEERARQKAIDEKRRKKEKEEAEKQKAIEAERKKKEREEAAARAKEEAEKKKAEEEARRKEKAEEDARLKAEREAERQEKLKQQKREHEEKMAKLQAEREEKLAEQKAKKEQLRMEREEKAEIKRLKKETSEKPSLKELIKMPKFSDKNHGRARKLKNNFSGHISVFVTSFRHGCGASYTAGSLAVALANRYNREVYIDRADNNASLPDDYLVKDISTEEDRFEAYKSGLIVYDRGPYENVKANAVDNSDMLRADLNIMTVTYEDLGNVAKFISEEENQAYDWLFVFNHVTDKERQKDIEAAMDGYSILFLPQHDFSAVTGQLQKDWNNVIDTMVNKF